MNILKVAETTPVEPSVPQNTKSNSLRPFYKTQSKTSDSKSDHEILWKTGLTKLLQGSRYTEISVTGTFCEILIWRGEGVNKTKA